MVTKTIEEIGVTPKALAFLHAIKECEGKSFRELCEAYGIHPSEGGRLKEILLAANCITITMEKGQRRRGPVLYLYVMPGQGTALLKAIPPEEIPVLLQTKQLRGKTPSSIVSLPRETKVTPPPPAQRPASNSPAFGQEENIDPKCTHHWIIETADGPTNWGACRLCGGKKVFSNFIEDVPIEDLPIGERKTKKRRE